MPDPNFDDRVKTDEAKPHPVHSETEVVAEKPYVMEVEQAQDQQLEGETETERKVDPFRHPTA